MNRESNTKGKAKRDELQQEGASVLQLLRHLENDDQKIALAVLEGMKLQKKIDVQRQVVNG